jgi:hypothetical protein
MHYVEDETDHHAYIKDTNVHHNMEIYETNAIIANCTQKHAEIRDVTSSRHHTDFLRAPQIAKRDESSHIAYATNESLPHVIYGTPTFPLYCKTCTAYTSPESRKSDETQMTKSHLPAKRSITQTEKSSQCTTDLREDAGIEPLPEASG